MKLPPRTLVVASLLITAGVIAGYGLARPSSSSKAALACDGEYADAMQLQSFKLREIEQGPRSQYTYLVRSSAKYECPYFGSDGKLRRRRVEVVEHGTAFAYEATTTETFLLTNEHVAAWAEVTDAVHKVDGVPLGCKRVEEKLRIVHDEHDDYEPAHLALVRVAVDPLLDAAVLKASQPLVALPYAVGKSAALRQGNAVQVRGFPLGLMQAVNTGKIVNPYDHDQEQGWDHIDFVVDALLSEGNSGSPVLAMSCKTGQLELVGMYHAGYKGASALNVVIGIDQVREFMAKKKRQPRVSAEVGQNEAAADHKRLLERLTATKLPLFEFGGLHVWTDVQGEQIRFHLYGRDFPVDDRRVAIIESRPASGGGASDGPRLWVRGDAAWREWTFAALGAEERELLLHMNEAMRVHLLAVLDYRRALDAQGTVDERRRGRELLRTIERHAQPARELSTNLLELAERLAPTKELPREISSRGSDGGVPLPGFASSPPMPKPL